MTRPYVTFILSLVVSDAFASFLLGFQLLFGSYLPVVKGQLVLTATKTRHFDLSESFFPPIKPVGVCVMLGAELLKLTGILVTVLHLLTMVAMHLAGVVNPVKFKEVRE